MPNLLPSLVSPATAHSRPTLLHVQPTPQLCGAGTRLRTYLDQEEACFSTA